MVPIMSLWLPILLSAVFVFLASFVLHMLLTYHFKDFKPVGDEDKVLTTMRSFNLPPGEYFLPYSDSHEKRKSAGFQEKMKSGSTFFVAVWGANADAMGKPLAQWFVYTLIVGIFVAYAAGRTLAPGEHYLGVFRIAGFVAFACYAVAQWQEYIWFKRSFGRTMRNTFDGLVYALLTAGTFGWLWPAE